MPGHRRYTKPQKLSVVLAADTAGLTATAESTGIPKSTIAYWLERPEFALFRTKAREELAEEIKVVAHLAWQRTAEALRDGTLEARDILFAAEKATNLQLLMSGEATARNETRSVVDDFNDHEKRALRDAVDRVLADTPAADPSDAAVESPSPTGADTALD